MNIVARRIAANLRRLRTVLDESGWLRGALRAGIALAGGGVSNRLIASDFYYRLVGSRTSERIARNQRFRNAHRGRRAYVAATGPSLAAQDLSALDDGVVISVNENFSYLKSRGVTAAYNLVQDHAYFDDLTTYGAFWRDLAAAVRDDGLVPVLPSSAARMLATRPEWSHFDPAYYFQLGNFLAVVDRGGSPSVDFAQPMPHQLTVTHAAVAWAMYLGCSEIYLLGVDLDYGDNLSEPMQHCYGTNPYFDYGSVSTRDLFAHNSRLAADDLRRHIELQGIAFDRIGEVAKAHGQAVFDAGLRGRAGRLPKRPLPALKAGSSSVAS